MKEKIKKEYLDEMKMQLNDIDFKKYLNCLDDKITHGMTINLNKLKISSIDLKYLIDRFELKEVFHNENYYYGVYDKEYLSKNGIFPGKDPLYHAGLYYIQEPTAAEVLFDVKFENDDFVLDLCASPGGKTSMVLFSLLEDKGFLVANEVDYGRISKLRTNVERIGYSNVAITSNTSDELKNVFYDFFDKVLVDAPCSGEGMFRKSDEAIRQWSKSYVVKCAKIQKKLLEDAYFMVKNGGLLIYSTCTFSVEEDEEVVDYMIKKYNDLRIVKSKKEYPFNSIGEGQFYTILKKGELNFSYDKKSIKKQRFNALKLIQYGINEYNQAKNFKEPSHASTHSTIYNFKNNVELNDEEILKYLMGEPIKKNVNFDGYCRITYKNLGIGLAKASNGILKNHYPKGLRNL